MLLSLLCSPQDFIRQLVEGNFEEQREQNGKKICNQAETDRQDKVEWRIDGRSILQQSECQSKNDGIQKVNCIRQFVGAYEEFRWERSADQAWNEISWKSYEFNSIETRPTIISTGVENDENARRNGDYRPSKEDA